LLAVENILFDGDRGLEGIIFESKAIRKGFAVLKMNYCIQSLR